MKTYKGARQDGKSTVTADGKPLTMWRKSTDTRTLSFAWGEQSPGAERLAFSMLVDCLGDSYGHQLAHAFMVEEVSKFKPEWEIRSDYIEQWADRKCAAACSAQQVEWTMVGSETPRPPA